AMDVFIRWSLAAEGKHTSQGAQYAQQAALYGAIQGALGPVAMGGQALGIALGHIVGRDIADSIADSIGAAVKRAANAEGKGAGTAARAGDNAFGRSVGDLAVAMAGSLESGGIRRASREVFADQAADAFGRYFAGTLGRDAARDMGRDWARTFMSAYGRGNLGDLLAATLSRVEFTELRNALSHRVVAALRTDWGRKVAGFAGDAAGYAAHQNLSEGFYNLLTTGDFTTTWETALAGGVAGLLSHALSRNAHRIGAGFREKMVLGRFPDAPVDPPKNVSPGPDHLLGGSGGPGKAMTFTGVTGPAGVPVVSTRTPFEPGGDAVSVLSSDGTLADSDSWQGKPGEEDPAKPGSDAVSVLSSDGTLADSDSWQGKPGEEDLAKPDSDIMSVLSGDTLGTDTDTDTDTGASGAAEAGTGVLAPRPASGAPGSRPAPVPGGGPASGTRPAAADGTRPGEGRGGLDNDGNGEGDAFEGLQERLRELRVPSGAGVSRPEGGQGGAGAGGDGAGVDADGGGEG
ncbi:hypothetical protein ABZV75_40065, partial [Streptomyces flaveolus]